MSFTSMRWGVTVSGRWSFARSILGPKIHADPIGQSRAQIHFSAIGRSGYVPARHPDVKRQLRAIWRASVHGDVRIMCPDDQHLMELRQARGAQ